MIRPQFKERREFFSDPRRADVTGVLALGLPLTSETLFEAYSFGVFPWPHEDYPLLWFCPARRGVLEFSRIHIPRSLGKFLRKNHYSLTFNKAFEDVIGACSRVRRKDQAGTWITEDMKAAYVKMHKLGYAHSVECWEKDRLVGGLYGVYIAGVFSGESMFHLQPNASKVALLGLVDRLKASGHTLMDIQQLTPHLKSLGAREISREEFLNFLDERKAYLKRCPHGEPLNLS